MIVKFHPLSKEIEWVVPPPKPASEYKPEWLKRLNGIDGPPRYGDNVIVNRTAQMCKPFVDTFETGYIQESWCDIHVAIGPDGMLHYNQSATPQMMSHRGNPESGKQLQLPKHFYSTEFVWHQPYVAELPKGYSMIITHPLNHWNLPFVTMTGIIENDTFVYESASNNLPFNIYNWFTGIIPAGTPLFQFIPIKRDKWERSIEEYNQERQAKSIHQIRRKFANQYRSLHWKRKEYK